MPTPSHPVRQIVAGALVFVHLCSIFPAQTLAAQVTIPNLQAKPELAGTAPVRMEPVVPTSGSSPQVVVNTTTPKGIQVAPPLSFSANPSAAEIAQCRLFAEPLLPMGTAAPTASETRDLANGILTFNANPAHEDTSALEQFLVAFPKSAFRVSLLTNLGVLYRHQGYWSKALDAWRQAWKFGKDENDPTKRLVVDRALSQLAEMTARLGRVEDLQAIFKEADGRNVSGAAAERYNGARESLLMEQHEPTKSFRCGPFAVGKILNVLHPAQGMTKEVHESVSTDHGTSLPMVEDLARRTGLYYQMAFRSPGAAVIVPSVVHWKVGHYAALTKEIGDHYLSEDSTFSETFVIGMPALDQEASGYFLVRAGTLPKGWRSVSSEEGSKVWGKGAASPTGPSAPCCDTPGVETCSSCYGMPAYDIDPSRVGLTLRDIPLFYAPPFGPKIEFAASYLEREISPSTVPTYSGLGPQWSTNWVTFIVDDPYNANTTSYGPGGGTLTYSNYQSSGSTTGAFAQQYLTQATLQRTSATSYVRTHPDGSVEVFGLADTSSPQRIYLTEFDDPQGNKLVYTYDTHFRLISLSDSLNQVSTLTYLSDDSTVTNGDFYRIKTVTDPFGRSTNFSYYTSGVCAGCLQQITDMGGMSSQFIYGSDGVVSELHTPYGKTTFAENVINAYRSLLITDPLGAHELVAFQYDMTPPDAKAPVPSGAGLSTAAGLAEYRTSYYWSKKAYGNTPIYSNAHLYHWTHGINSDVSSDVLESEKPALESRIYYNYAGQYGSYASSELGSSNKPTTIARVLDDGSSQLWQYGYNPQGNVTQRTTPGSSTTPARAMTYSYATNGVDLAAIYQENAAGASMDGYGVAADLLQSFTYDTQGKHLVIVSTDTAGQRTTYSYNIFGQVLTITNAKGETTNFIYDGDRAAVSGQTDGYLTVVTAPSPGATTRFGYDSYGRRSKVTDSGGYTLVIGYDFFNRVSTRTYPDATYEEVDYDRMEPQWTRDRLGRWTGLLHDELRHLTGVLDPMNRLTQYVWCNCGALDAIIDGNGNKTTWMRDVESRVTAKTYADQSVWTTTYENTTSRVKSTTDAKQQCTNYLYNIDDTLNQVYYTDTNGNALVPSTPSISYTYDPVYPRLLSSTVQRSGSNEPTTYTYNPVPLTPTLGAGRLASEAGTFANSTITFEYDELGRVIQQAINGGANNSTFGYDSLGRTQAVSNPLGAFTYNFVGDTSRLGSVAFPNGQMTQYSYFNGNNDPRLETIMNEDSSGSIISQFDYTYSAVGDIMSWTENNSGLAHPQQYQFGYDADSELTSATLQDTVTGNIVSAQAYAYDTAMNRISVQNGSSVTTETSNSLNQLIQVSSSGLMRFAGTVSKPATVTIGGNAATVRADGTYEGWALVNASGSTQVHIVAIDGNNNVTDKYTTIMPNQAGTTQNLSYDANGNQTLAGSFTYGWNAADQIVTITNGADVTEFEYDGLGRRVREKLNGAEIRHWIWAGINLAEERDASNSVTKRFFDQGEQLGNQSFFFACDALGSVREIIDSAQTVRGRYSYDPYGIRSSNLVVSNPIEADFGYSSHYFHQSSGLEFAPFRVYNASIGRWLSQDPSEESTGINLYDYTNNNPMNFYDPDGLDPKPITQPGNAAIDTDGNGPSHNDPTHQPQLAGGNANADVVPYVVVPRKYLPKGIKPGSDVNINFRGKDYHCKVKDVGPNSTPTNKNGVGEMSIAQARQMGIPIKETPHGPEPNGSFPLTITYYPKGRH